MAQRIGPLGAREWDGKLMDFGAKKKAVTTCSKAIWEDDLESANQTLLGRFPCSTINDFGVFPTTD